MRLLLFTRDDCSLCDKAKVLLEDLEVQVFERTVGAERLFVPVAITAHPYLLQRYDWSIPVVFRSSAERQYDADGRLDQLSMQLLVEEIQSEIEKGSDLKDRLSSELYWPFPFSRLRSFYFQGSSSIG